MVESVANARGNLWDLLGAITEEEPSWAGTLRGGVSFLLPTGLSTLMRTRLFGIGATVSGPHAMNRFPTP